jgi:hypothetical protein
MIFLSTVVSSVERGMKETPRVVNCVPSLMILIPATQPSYHLRSHWWKQILEFLTAANLRNELHGARHFVNIDSSRLVKAFLLWNITIY